MSNTKISVGYYVNSNPNDLIVIVSTVDENWEEHIENINYPIDEISGLKDLVDALSKNTTQEDKQEVKQALDLDPIPDYEYEDEKESTKEKWIRYVKNIGKALAFWCVIYILSLSYNLTQDSKEEMIKKELLQESQTTTCKIEKPFEVLSELDSQLQNKQNEELEIQQKLRIKKAWKTESEKALLNFWIDSSKNNFSGIQQTRKMIDDLKIRISNILN